MIERFEITTIRNTLVQRTQSVPVVDERRGIDTVRQPGTFVGKMMVAGENGRTFVDVERLGSGVEKPFRPTIDSKKDA